MYLGVALIAGYSESTYWSRGSLWSDKTNKLVQILMTDYFKEVF